MSKFKESDRVRIKFGVDRGIYGTVTSVGGDDGTYYGVKADCRETPAGYSEYELEFADSHRHEIYCRGCFVLGSACGKCMRCWREMKNQVQLPSSAGTCPECRAPLTARSMSWDAMTDRPIGSSLEIECTHDQENGGHHYRQSDWQPTIDAVRIWCDASKD